MYINKQIPAGIILKALGYTTDKEIKQLINLDSEITEPYINYTGDSFFIQTKDDVLEYIGKFSIHMIKEVNKKIMPDKWFIQKCFRILV